MAAKPKTHVGTMECLCCGHEIPVKVAETGTLNLPCSWCDFPAYAKPGTQAHRIITAKLKNQPAPAPAAKPPAPEATPPAPAPAAKPRASIFHGLGGGQ